MRQFQAIEALDAARTILHAQGIIAVKGLGGYHLVCDARSVAALTRLRRSKQRPHKPFAVMFRDLDALQKELCTSPLTAKVLTSRAKPIVILSRRKQCSLPDLIAPGLDTIGAMLPYTSLYFCLFDQLLDALVVTSANTAGEPVIFQDEVACQQLAAIADGILTHDREISYPLDDSVLYYADTTEAGERPQKQPTHILLRRGRGYVPTPLLLYQPLGQTILGCGSDVKACFCLGSERHAYPSPYLGNLENPETLERYRFLLRYYRETFQLDPTIVAYDLNPALVSSQLLHAEGFHGLTWVPIQHHHAHIAACMGENRIDRPVIGVAYDGSGYGLDGKVWGGEILLCHLADFERLAHWQNVPLPGNELAIRQPWRMTLSYLISSGMEEPCQVFIEELPEGFRQTANQLLSLWENIQPSWLQTSSMGRLFDGIAAFLGLCLEATYTGQPAILLENTAWQGVKQLGLHRVQPYDTLLCPEHLPESISPTPLFQCIAKDRANEVDIREIAARSHRTIAEMTATKAGELCGHFGVDTVALSGGVWQNQLLGYWTTTLLGEMGLNVIRHRQLSPSDENLGFGQVVVAGAKLRT